MNKTLALLILITSNVSLANENAVVLDKSNKDHKTTQLSDEIPNQANQMAAATKQAIKEGSGKESDGPELKENENYRTISSEENKNEN